MARTFFQVLLSTIFYKKSGTFNETSLTLSSLACTGFCFLINLNLRKFLASLLASFALSIHKNLGASRLIAVTTPFHVWSFSKCFVCVFCSFTPFLSVLICTSQEELSLIASNDEIYDFYNWVIFKKKIHGGK